MTNLALSHQKFAASDSRGHMETYIFVDLKRMGRADRRGRGNGERPFSGSAAGARQLGQPPNGYKLWEFAYILLSFYKPLAEKRDCEKSCRSNRSFVNYRFTKTSAPLPSLRNPKSVRKEINIYTHWALKRSLLFNAHSEC